MWVALVTGLGLILSGEGWIVYRMGQVETKIDELRGIIADHESRIRKIERVCVKSAADGGESWAAQS